jgi:hypothetical protein
MYNYTLKHYGFLFGIYFIGVLSSNMILKERENFLIFTF